ncbi:MAG: 3-phosphoserine/phosphohydroxythreonine transaminase [Eubacteriales bacterium]
MKRIYNFSAGPSMLPLPVLEQAAAEMLDCRGSGCSVMEMSHRSPVYDAIIKKAEADLRTLMEIPDNYKVLFLQGGATTQFSAVPLNLMNGSGKADYIVSGQFSKKAATEAEKYGTVNVLASSKDRNFAYIPHVTEFTPDADYVHICFNNTIFGTTYNYIPDTGDIPLVADVSSCILSRPIDVKRFGLLYAGAQKNMGPAGLTVVIVREDLIGHARPDTPVLLDYKVQADADSMYNTPPCYSIYIAGLVFEWLLGLGGLKEMEKMNVDKAKLLYDYLDKSSLFIPVADKDCRSIMNVCFRTADPELDKQFCSEAKAAGLENLKGHRSVGGMRASIYNAMPAEGVKALVDFMAEFERNHK